MSARRRSILCWLVLAVLSSGIGWLLDRSMPVGPRWELGPEYDFPLAEYAAGRGIWLRSDQDGIALHDLDHGTHRCFDLQIRSEYLYLPSPDGRCLAVTLQDGSDTLYLLDAHRQTQHQRKIPGLNQQLETAHISESMTFSPAGDLLYLHHARELCDSTLAVRAIVPAQPDEVVHAAFEGKGARLKVWLRNPHRVLCWDSRARDWERSNEGREFRKASNDGRYVLLQHPTGAWNLCDLRTETAHDLGLSNQSLHFSSDSSFLIEEGESKGKEPTYVNYRIWSIASGKWSKPFVFPADRWNLTDSCAKNVKFLRSLILPVQRRIGPNEVFAAIG